MITSIKYLIEEAIRDKIRNEIKQMNFGEEVERYIDETDFSTEIEMATNCIIEEEINDRPIEEMAYDIAMEEIREAIR